MSMANNHSHTMGRPPNHNRQFKFIKSNSYEHERSIVIVSIIIVVIIIYCNHQTNCSTTNKPANSTGATNSSDNSTTIAATRQLSPVGGKHGTSTNSSLLSDWQLLLQHSMPTADGTTTTTTRLPATQKDVETRRSLFVPLGEEQAGWQHQNNSSSDPSNLKSDAKNGWLGSSSSLVASRDKRDLPFAAIRLDDNDHDDEDSSAISNQTGQLSAAIGGRRAHRHRATSRRPQLTIRSSINPSANVTHMKMTTRPFPASSDSQDHLYDEQELTSSARNSTTTTTTTRTPLQPKSTTASRRQPRRGTPTERNQRLDNNYQTTTVATSSAPKLTERGLDNGGGDYDGDSDTSLLSLAPTRAPTLGQTVANLEPELESPPSSDSTGGTAQTEPTRFTDSEEQQQQPRASPYALEHSSPPPLQGAGLSAGNVAELERQIEILQDLQRTRSQLEGRVANLKAAQGSAAAAIADDPSASAGLSVQVPPPEESSLKGNGRAQAAGPERIGSNNADDQLQDSELSAGGNNDNTVLGGGDNSDQQDSVVPQVGDSQVLASQPEHNKKTVTLDSHQLRQLIQSSQNGFIKRTKARPNKVAHQSHHTVTKAYQQQQQQHPAATDLASISYEEPIVKQAPSFTVRSNPPYAPIASGTMATFNNNENNNQLLQSVARPNYGHPFANELVDHVNFAPVHPVYSSLIGPQVQPPVRQRLLPELSNHIEETFYNNNTSHTRIRPSKRAVASERLKQLTETSRAPSGAIGRVKAAASRHYPNLVSPAQNLYQRPILATLHPSAQDVAADHYSMAPQSQVLGLLRAAIPNSGSSIVGSNLQNVPTQSSAMLRRTSPLTGGSIGHHYHASSPYGSLLPPLPTSAYILPTYSSIPYSSTSQKHPRATTMFSPSQQRQQQQMTSSFQQRIGKVSGSSSGNSDDYSSQASAPAAASSDPMWSDTQNQEDEYQQAPQTIQITAVPNGVGAFGNGWNGFNGFNGVNGWNGWGGPWNGRQVLLVNRQPPTVGSAGSEWRQWVLPIAAILALPLILGSLFVPVFLKSVMFLIQILQMLGLLMPPGQLAGHLASSSHSLTQG